jgi:hypothetical protein
MPQSPRPGPAHVRPDEQQLREQEVLRANRELAAYFKGRRTEREARAALKIIKAFIRDRERTDPAKRRPLPGMNPAGEAITARKRARTSGRKVARRRGRRTEEKMFGDAEPLSAASESKEELTEE